jgi:uncharacterized protein YjbJ (UPF0337 family)
MARTRRRRKPPEGTLDKLMGRAVETFARVTGKRKAAVAGKGVRARGKARSAKGGVRRGRR